MWEGAATCAGCDEHSCADVAWSLLVSLGGWVAQIRKDLAVAEKYKPS